MPLPIDPTCLNCGSISPPNASVCRVCGVPLEVQEFLPANTRVGHFVIEKVLGRGGFGITYKAQDVSSGTTVALKELMPEGMGSRGANGAVNIHTNQMADFEEIKTKFIAEAQLLRKITDAASAKFVDLVAQNQTLYMAMDFVEGVTLESRIASGSLLSVKETRSILRDVLGVLEEMHLLNILHRDIKPANIILQPGGAKLIDFGSGLQFQKNKTIRVTSRVLTPAYAPLELYGQNIRLSAAADLYSLAATIYEAMTSVRIPSALERANGKQLQALSNLEPNTPEGLVNAIDKALEIRVDARPQSVQEFRELLDAPDEKAKKTPIHTAHNSAANQVTTTSVPSRIGFQSVASTVTGQTTITGWLRYENTILIIPLFEILLLMIFSLFVLPFDSNRAQIIFFALITATIVYVMSISIAWALVQPVRWYCDWFSLGAASKNLPLSFYRQSMLGLYSFVIATVFVFPFRNTTGTFDFIKIIPLLFLAGFLATIGLGIAHANNQVLVRRLKFPTFLALHLLIPALIVGTYLNPFTSLMTSAKPTLSSQITNNSSGTISNIQTPTSSSVVNFANINIVGSGQLCSETSYNFPRTTSGGTLLVPLDDESSEVSLAISPILNAEVTPCWRVVNDFTRLTYYQPFNQMLIMYRRSFSGRKIIMVTAKPIEMTVGYWGRLAHRKNNVTIVSTDKLKTVNYRNSYDAKNKFLERVVTVIKLQQTKDKPQIKNLEALDRLWRK
jgi:Protein kinase domain